MRFQPNRDYVSNDEVQTPLPLAKLLVRHFNPRGRVLEPCRGHGHIFRYLPVAAQWCEINEGRDFLDHKTPTDWIITNPPWSRIREFLLHSMSLAEHVVFLMTVNHAWTRARVRDVRENGFGFREICLFDMPRTFPQSGFQLGAVYWQKGWTGPLTITDFTSKKPSARRLPKRLEPEPEVEAVATPTIISSSRKTTPKKGARIGGKSKAGVVLSP